MYHETPRIPCLRARDPSIIAWNVTDLHQLNSRWDFNKDPNWTNSESKESNISVYLRLKNLNDNISSYSFNKTEITLGSGTLQSSFQFSRIFGPNDSQNEVFDTVVKPKMLLFINGINSSLLTYGTSGSGKTYTMVGTSLNPGFIPRALEYLFRSLPKLPSSPSMILEANGRISNRENCSVENKSSNILQELSHAEKNSNETTYCAMRERLSTEPVATLENYPSCVLLGVYVSFLEVYNEEIYDLLSKESQGTRRKLKIAVNENGPYVKNLTLMHVNDGLTAFNVFQYGLKKVKTAETKSNDQSNRSHIIFTIRLMQYSKSTNVSQVSYFNFCDLAGCHKRESIYTGIRFRESKNINTSLFVLGKCLKQILQKSKKKDIIPYRESKLTHLLMNSLNGTDNTSMMITVNTNNSLENNINILNFAAILPSQRDPMMNEIKEEIKNLKQELIEIREVNKKLDSQAYYEGKKEAEKMINEIHKKYEEKFENLEKFYEEQFEMQKNAILLQDAKKKQEKRDKLARRRLEKEIQERQDELKKLKNEKINLQNEVMAYRQENMFLNYQKLELETQIEFS